MSIKILLAALTLFNFISWLFVIIATAITDWSKSSLRQYGIWDVCDFVFGGGKNCYNWDITESSALKTCEGSLTATRAFSVLSIIFVTFCLCISVALLAKPTLIKKTTVLVNLCMLLITNLWLFLGWIMYLGVEARGQCAFADYGTHLGSSWFLQIFAWIVGLISCILGVLIFLKWKKTPRFCGQPAYIPGPAPVPCGPCYPQYSSGSVPYNDPYATGPKPYYPSAPQAAPVAYPPPYSSAYSGVNGPTPNTSPSPYSPTPYW